jgi:surface protein
MSGMFNSTPNFNKNLNSWDVSQVTDMSAMFSSAASFNQNLSGWDVGLVENMSDMFKSATAFNQDISTWDVSQVDDMRFMFSNASVFNQNIGGWDVSSVETMEGMFSQTASFDQDLSTWNVSNVTDMTEMFYETGLSVSNYDALLMGWYNNGSLQSNVVFDAGNSKFCAGYFDRLGMIQDYNWTILDSGIDQPVLMSNQCYINVGTALNEDPGPGTMIHVIGNAIDSTFTNLHEIHIKIYPQATLTAQSFENYGTFTVSGILDVLGM